MEIVKISVWGLNNWLFTLIISCGFTSFIAAVDYARVIET